MTVTRDIVKDLLVVYLAGDASSDTRALVEEWLRRDPELARQADAARQPALPPVPAVPPALEKRALDRTRRHLRWRMLLFGLAAYVTSLPLSVTFGSSGFEGLLIDDWTGRSVVLLLAGGLWLLYWLVSRRVRVTGL